MTVAMVAAASMGQVPTRSVSAPSTTRPTTRATQYPDRMRPAVAVGSATASMRKTKAHIPTTVSMPVLTVTTSNPTTARDGSRHSGRADAGIGGAADPDALRSPAAAVQRPAVKVKSTASVPCRIMTPRYAARQL